MTSTKTPKYDRDEELDFLRGYDKGGRDRPLSTVNVVLMTLVDGKLAALLTLRAEHPQKGKWALPGVVVNVAEDGDFDQVAERAASDKTGYGHALQWIEQLKTYGGPARDPRGWSASVAYYGLVPRLAADPHDARVASARWFEIDQIESMDLAFDHGAIVADAAKRLRDKVGYTLIAANVLPSEFTLAELQEAHEQILGRKLDKSSFRKRVEENGDIEPIEGKMRSGSNRPAQLYRAVKVKVPKAFRRSIV